MHFTAVLTVSVIVRVFDLVKVSCYLYFFLRLMWNVVDMYECSVSAECVHTFEFLYHETNIARTKL